MTWAAFIAIVETEYAEHFQKELVWLEVDRFRSLLVCAYTEGFAEGQKHGSKSPDTHHLFKFLRGELAARAGTDANGTIKPLPALKKNDPAL